MRRPAALLCVVLLSLGWCRAAAFAAGTTPTASTVSTTTSSAPGATSTTSTTATTTTTTTSDAPTSTTAARAAVHHAAAALHAATPGDAVVTIKSGTGACLYCFSPAAVTIPAGASVTFTNQSGADHTIARCTPTACDGVAGGTGADSAFTPTVAISDGASYSHSFTQPGTYVYYCTIHGYDVMHGTITVTAASTTTISAGPATTTGTTAAPVAGTANPLASTGSSSEPLVLVGLVVLLAGTAAVAIGSRRRTHH